MQQWEHHHALLWSQKSSRIVSIARRRFSCLVGPLGIADFSLGPKWRPRSLSASVLVPLISYTILLMVALAVLQRKSNRDGGILFADSVEDMPFSYIFIQNYLPTIAAVLYNTICVWIDLDIKRLEPWYNLSQKAGANGENSVLLDYPAEFLPLVPLKSMKNRCVSRYSMLLVVIYPHE